MESLEALLRPVARMINRQIVAKTPARELCAELGLSAAATAHRYALDMEGVDTVVLGVTVFYAAIVIALNLVVDLLYGFLDPRIRGK